MNRRAASTQRTAADWRRSFVGCAASVGWRSSGSPTTFPPSVRQPIGSPCCTAATYPDEASSNMCREANAFNKGGAGASNSYLVMTTPIDGTQYDFLYISAQVYSRFTGAGGISFVYSTNYSGTGDPEADGVTWTELTEINAALPAAGTQDWKSVAQLVENVGDDLVYIAIQHKGGTTGSSSSWRIDDFSIKGN